MVPWESPQGPPEVPDVSTFRGPSGDVPRTSRVGCGTTLRITKKNVQGEKLPHELLLTRGQKTKMRNPFANNMSTDIKLSKAQLSKIIQSVGFVVVLLGRLNGPLMKNGVPFAKTFWHHYPLWHQILQ